MTAIPGKFQHPSDQADPSELRRALQRAALQLATTGCRPSGSEVCHECDRNIFVMQCCWERHLLRPPDPPPGPRPRNRKPRVEKPPKVYPPLRFVEDE